MKISGVVVINTLNLWRSCFSLVFLLLIFSLAKADSESIDGVNQNFSLLIRADQFNPYFLPDYTLMPNMSAACFRKTQFAVRYWKVGDEETKIFVKFYNGNNFVTSSGFDQGYVVSDLSINERGVLFPVNDRLSTLGVFLISKEGVQKKIVNPNDFLNLKAISRPAFMKNEVLFRGVHGDGLRKLYIGQRALLKEESSNMAYIFLPSVRNDEMVVKINYGTPGEVKRSNPDEILLYQNNKFQSVAKDVDFDKDSKFLSFDNSPIPDGHGGVVFIAETEKDGRSIWYFKKTSSGHDLNMIYSPKKEPSFGELEYFRPAVGNGKIVFRLIYNGKRRVASWDSENGLKIIISQGDSVITNEELLSVINKEKWPAFSGAPCVSSTGSTYIHAVLESIEDNENKGSGVFEYKL